MDREVCEGVCKLIGNLCQKLKTPFVLCCAFGAKILAFQTKQGPYVVRCRSPLIDEHHLDLVREWLGKPRYEIEEAWEQLPPFGSDLVAEVLSLVEAERIDLMVTQESMMELGELYSPYEADILAYTNLDNITRTEQRRVFGNVKIELVIKKGQIGIGRIISHQFMPEVEEKEEKKKPMTAVPIVGFILHAETDNAKGILQSTSFRDASKGVSESLYGPAYEKNVAPKIVHYPCNNHDWYAEITVKPPIEAEAKYDYDTWRKCCEDRFEPALHVLTKTAPLGLLELLGEEHEPWRKFLDLLFKLLEPSLYKPIGVKSLEKKPERLWYQVFCDLSVILKRISTSRQRCVMQVTKPALEKTLLALSQFSPLDPFPGSEVFDDDRLKILEHDLVAGETDYIRTIRDTFIRFLLKRNEYRARTVEDCLRMDSPKTFEAIIEATEKGSISLNQEPGTEAWQVLMKWDRTTIERLLRPSKYVSRLLGREKLRFWQRAFLEDVARYKLAKLWRSNWELASSLKEFFQSDKFRPETEGQRIVRNVSRERSR
jgi:hypothetical protein